jgi:hypothetical protein
MHRKTSLLSVLAACAVAMTMALVSASPARAGTGQVDYHDSQVVVWGSIAVYDDHTEWNLHARLGVSPYKQCVYLRLEVDINNWSDKVYTSLPGRLCPGNTGALNFSSEGSKTHRGTRGARLKAVWENVGYREVIYVRE